MPGYLLMTAGESAGSLVAEDGIALALVGGPYDGETRYVLGPITPPFSVFIGEVPYLAIGQRLDDGRLVYRAGVVTTRLAARPPGH
jgi:hypothetical protein